METDCKSVDLCLRRFESCTCHANLDGPAQVTVRDSGGSPIILMQNLLRDIPTSSASGTPAGGQRTAPHFRHASSLRR